MRDFPHFFCFAPIYDDNENVNFQIMKNNEVKIQPFKLEFLNSLYISYHPILSPPKFNEQHPLYWINSIRTVLQPLSSSVKWIIMCLLQLAFPILPKLAYLVKDPFLHPWLLVSGNLKFWLQHTCNKLDISTDTRHTLIIIESFTLIPVQPATCPFSSP